MAVSPAAGAALLFITVSARDGDAPRVSKGGEGLAPKAGLPLGTPPFHNKAVASDCIRPQSLIKISGDRQ